MNIAQESTLSNFSVLFKTALFLFKTDLFSWRTVYIAVI